MADLPPNASLSDDTDATQDDLDEMEASPLGISDTDDMVEQPDGSYLIKDPAPRAARRGKRFDDNLADGLIPDDMLASLGREFCELVEADKEARAERDKQYAEGIKKTGQGNNRNVGADFDGASAVVHPMLAKGCVDFASKAVKELFPSSGPVRTQILGRQTEAKLDRAERKKTYMNWQLTEQIPEHRSEFEKMLSQLPLGGSQYKRWWYDAKMGRARTMSVYIDNIFLPYDQNDFYTSPRLTHQEFIGRTEFESRIDSGLYIDVDIMSGGTPERSSSDKAAREIEGVADDSAAYGKTGGSREVFTIYADIELEDDPLCGDGPAPYILHVEEYGSRVLGIYRNWAEKDKKRTKLHWIVEYNFIPWRGAYAVGLAHLIGSLSTAATGALNALLDAAHINNFPGGLKLKGGRTSGQTISVNATELREIDAPPGVDDIRKLVMAFPFNGPSTVLQTLMEWLTQQAEIVVSTASEKIADAGANMPMGTALALIEGGSTNFSAIHARLHHSARRELEILHRLDATYMSDQETVEELGELVVYREDFQGPMDILPVSDPNIFSEAQRYAQLQAVMQLEAMPQFQPFFKPERLLIRALRLLQVPYAEDIANLPKDPMRMDPVEENSAAALDDGTPLKVYEEQDDLSHLESHVTFMTSPLLGGSPLIGATALPKLLAHCKEHMIAYYRKHHEAASKALTVITRQQGIQLTPEQAASKGHAFADKAMATQLAPMVAPGLQQAQQLAQQFAIKPQADPNTQATLAAQQAIEQAKLADRDKDRQNELAIRKMDLDAEDRRTDKENAQQTQAAQLATQAEAAQNASDQTIAVLTLRMQDHQEHVREENKKLLADMKAQSDAALMVLQQLLAGQAAQAEAATAAGEAAQKAPDLAQVIQPLLDSIVQNNKALADQFAAQANGTQDALGQLAQGMQALHKAHSAPRVASYIKDANGEVLGVKSSIEGAPNT
jgi:hypothetical protein